MKKMILWALVVLLFSKGIFPASADDEPTPQGIAVHNAKELAAVSGNESYYLANDILISGKWTSPTRFAGTLNGNGHAIVFSDATVTGGLFHELAGATISNLKLTEGELENSFKMKIGSENNFYLGVLVHQGYGLLESVYSDVDIGDYSTITTLCAGGLIGGMQGGNLTMRDCIQAGDLKAGKYAGGFVGTVSSPNIYQLTLERCVNYGDIGGGKVAGGLIGHTNGQCLDVLVQACANYGAISNNTNDQVGGICGYTKPSGKNGTITFKGNINYGSVTNQKPVAQASGIVARIHANNGGTLMICGNVNYAAPTTAEGQTGATANILAYLNSTYSNASEITGNYAKTLDGLHPTDSTPEWGNGELITENTLAALNQVMPDGYTMSGEVIRLKWMVDAGLTEVPPTISYDVSNSQIQDNGVETTTETPGQVTTGGAVVTNAPKDTEQSTTNAGDGTSQSEENSGGCGSAFGGTGMLLLLCIGGLACGAMIRKEQN